jgi:hypothetical protein
MTAKTMAEIRAEVLSDMPRSVPRETASAATLERTETPGGHIVPGLILDHIDSGKCTITVPAALVREKALEASEKWLLRVQGRFVGAEIPNRNGAMWTADDLLYGQPTVTHGPLNWLHNEKKVVGTITDSSFVERVQSAAGKVTEPHLQASSVIWRWLYPEEARMAERAADNSSLWYSMECISENVECSPGAGGCGAKFPYETYMRQRAKTCEHMMKGSVARRFENPVFQGGALIVPPVRPGWADADADVVRTAAAAADGLNAADFMLEASDLAAMLQQVASWQKAGV